MTVPKPTAECKACLEVPKDNVHGDPTHVDCGASESAHHAVIAALRAENVKLNAKLTDLYDWDKLRKPRSTTIRSEA